jgi:hypothetical protein
MKCSCHVEQIPPFFIALEAVLSHGFCKSFVVVTFLGVFRQIMSTYFLLQGKRNHPVEAIFSATDTAEENRIAECKAATQIQAAARMHHSRTAFVHVRNSVINVQRVFRGYRGRKRYFDAAIARAISRRRAVFDHFATVIQSRFRGFYSRKWKADFIAQKRYLVQVEAQSQKVRQDAFEAREMQTVHLAATMEQERAAAFNKAAGNMHHLLSTAARSGILRPAVAVTGLQTVFGTNIEDELRNVPIPRRKFRGEIIPVSSRHANPNSSPLMGSQEPLRKGGSSRTNMSVSRQPYVRSLLSDGAYDAHSQQSKLDQAVHHRMVEKIHGSKSFVTRKPAPPKDNITINAQTPYGPGKQEPSHI